MKKKFSKAIVYIFVLLLLLPSVCWEIILLIPNAEEVFNKDIGENRQLAVISEDVSLSDMTSQWEAYYSDHAPFRNVLILTNQKINGVIEKNYMSSVQPFLLQCFYEEEEKEETLELYLPEKDDIIQATETINEIETVEVVETETTEHDYIFTERVESTCIADGYTIYVCAECGAEKRETIPANGHEGIETDAVEASYLTYGHKTYQCVNCQETWWADFTPKLVDTTYFPEVVYNDIIIQGRSNWLFYKKDDSVSYYKGTNILSEEEMANNLKLMEQLQEVCDAKGIKLVFMVWPNKEQVYSEYMPTYEYVEKRKRLDIFTDYVKENSAIKFEYPLEELKRGKMYYDTYYAYDTHWNNAGAFIGVMEIYDALGMETMDIADVKTVPTSEVLLGCCIVGNLDYRQYPRDTDVEIDYKKDIQILNTQGVCDIAVGNDPIYKVETNSSNKCNFVLIGDSFRVSMVPYLQKDFSSSVFIHRDNLSEAKSEIQNADVLVVSAVERLDEEMFANIPEIISYLSE